MEQSNVMPEAPQSSFSKHWLHDDYAHGQDDVEVKTEVKREVPPPKKGGSRPDRNYRSIWPLACPLYKHDPLTYGGPRGCADWCTSLVHRLPQDHLQSHLRRGHISKDDLARAKKTPPKDRSLSQQKWVEARWISVYMLLTKTTNRLTVPSPYYERNDLKPDSQPGSSSTGTGIRTSPTLQQQTFAIPTYASPGPMSTFREPPQSSTGPSERGTETSESVTNPSQSERSSQEPVLISEIPPPIPLSPREAQNPDIFTLFTTLGSHASTPAAKSAFSPPTTRFPYSPDPTSHHVTEDLPELAPAILSPPSAFTDDAFDWSLADDDMCLDLGDPCDAPAENKKESDLHQDWKPQAVPHADGLVHLLREKRSPPWNRNSWVSNSLWSSRGDKKAKSKLNNPNTTPGFGAALPSLELPVSSISQPSAARSASAQQSDTKSQTEGSRPEIEHLGRLIRHGPGEGWSSRKVQNLPKMSRFPKSFSKVKSIKEAEASSSVDVDPERLDHPSSNTSVYTPPEPLAESFHRHRGGRDERSSTKVDDRDVKSRSPLPVTSREEAIESSVQGHSQERGEAAFSPLSSWKLPEREETPAKPSNLPTITPVDTALYTFMSPPEPHPVMHMNLSCDGCVTSESECSRDTHACQHCRDQGLACHYNISQRRSERYEGLPAGVSPSPIQKVAETQPSGDCLAEMSQPSSKADRTPRPMPAFDRSKEWITISEVPTTSWIETPPSGDIERSSRPVDPSKSEQYSPYETSSYDSESPISEKDGFFHGHPRDLGQKRRKQPTMPSSLALDKSISKHTAPSGGWPMAGGIPPSPFGEQSSHFGSQSSKEEPEQDKSVRQVSSREDARGPLERLAMGHTRMFSPFSEEQKRELEQRRKIQQPKYRDNAEVWTGGALQWNQNSAPLSREGFLGCSMNPTPIPPMFSPPGIPPPAGRATAVEEEKIESKEDPDSSAPYGSQAQRGSVTVLPAPTSWLPRNVAKPMSDQEYRGMAKSIPREQAESRTSSARKSKLQFRSTSIPYSPLPSRAREAIPIDSIDSLTAMLENVDVAGQKELKDVNDLKDLKEVKKEEEEIEIKPDPDAPNTPTDQDMEKKIKKEKISAMETM